MPGPSLCDAPFSAYHTTQATGGTIPLMDGDAGTGPQPAEVTLPAVGGAFQPGPSGTDCHLFLGPFPAVTQAALLCNWRNACCSSWGGMKLPELAYPGADAYRLGRGCWDTSPRSQLPGFPPQVCSSSQKMELAGNCSLPNMHWQSQCPKARQRLGLRREKNAFFPRASQQPKERGTELSLRFAAPKHVPIQTTTPHGC